MNAAVKNSREGYSRIESFLSKNSPLSGSSFSELKIKTEINHDNVRLQ